MTERTNRDVVDILASDHQKANSLFDDIRSTNDVDTKRGLALELIKELCIHSGTETNVFYPACRKYLPESNNLVDLALEEHLVLENALNDLSDLNPADTRFDTKLQEIIQQVENHVQEEENDLFPKLKAHTTLDQRLELGRKLENNRSLVPTRPHPHLPKSGLAGQAARFIVAPLDRAADVLTSRTE